MLLWETVLEYTVLIAIYFWSSIVILVNACCLCRYGWGMQINFINVLEYVLTAMDTRSAAIHVDSVIVNCFCLMRRLGLTDTMIEGY